MREALCFYEKKKKYLQNSADGHWAGRDICNYVVNTVIIFIYDSLPEDMTLYSSES